jgi:hypothetical protein
MGIVPLAATFLIVALVLFMAPQFARAETDSAPPAIQTASASTCGKTIDEKLAAAQKALQSNGADARAAVGCLIEATTAIKQTLHSCDADHSQYGLLHVTPRDEPFAPSPK